MRGCVSINKKANHFAFILKFYCVINIQEKKKKKRATNLKHPINCRAKEKEEQQNELEFK